MSCLLVGAWFARPETSALYLGCVYSGNPCLYIFILSRFILSLLHHYGEKLDGFPVECFHAVRQGRVEIQAVARI